MVCICPTCGQPTGANAVEDIALERKLRPKEAAVLRALFGARGRPVTTERLIEIVWADEPSGGPLWDKTSLSVHIARLRQKIVGSGVAITATRGVGYRIVKGDGGKV